jgi:hypothetical protein
MYVNMHFGLQYPVCWFVRYSAKLYHLFRFFSVGLDVNWRHGGGGETRPFPILMAFFRYSFGYIDDNHSTTHKFRASPWSRCKLCLLWYLTRLQCWLLVLLFIGKSALLEPRPSLEDSARFDPVFTFSSFAKIFFYRPWSSALRAILLLLFLLRVLIL